MFLKIEKTKSKFNYKKFLQKYFKREHINKFNS